MGAGTPGTKTQNEKRCAVGKIPNAQINPKDTPQVCALRLGMVKKCPGDCIDCWKAKVKE